MALLDEIQKAGSIVGDIGGVISQGLGIFTSVKETLYPSYSQSPPAPEPMPEPVSASPIVKQTSSLSGGLGDNKVLIIGALVVVYLLFGRK